MVAGKGKKKNIVGHAIPRDAKGANKAIEKAVTKAEKLAHRYQNGTEGVKGKIAVSKVAEKVRVRESQLRARTRGKQIEAVPGKLPPLAGLTEGVSRRSLISTVVGLAGFILCCVPAGALSIISGLVAFILGLRELNLKNPSGTSLKSKGFAIAGVVLGLLSIIGALAWLMFFIYWVQSGFSSVSLR